MDIEKGAVHVFAFALEWGISIKKCWKLHRARLKMIRDLSRMLV
jgi:hypothetical protein